MSRVLSAAILVGILGVTIWRLPWWATVVLAALAAAMAGAELAGLARAVGARISALFPATFAATAAVAVSATEITGDVLVAVLVSGLVAAGLLTLASGRPGPPTITAAAVTMMAPLYVGLPLGVLASIRIWWGPGPLTWLVAVIAISDSAQYYTGRAFGRRKLAPLVSPGKTIEGAIGGLVMAVAGRRRAGAAVAAGCAARVGRAALAARRELRHRRRPLRVAAQAQRRRERQLDADPGPRRRARPRRRAPVRRADLLPVPEVPGVKRIAILGSTGSIGRSALSVVDAHPDRLQVVALAAGENTAALADQIVKYRPRAVGVATPGALEDLSGRLSSADRPAAVTCGTDGLVAVATHPDVDVVLCASSGTAGLEAALAALEAGKAIALANKEVLVMAGSLMVETARRRGVAHPARRQRAQRHPPVSARTTPATKCAG